LLNIFFYQQRKVLQLKKKFNKWYVGIEQNAYLRRFLTEDEDEV